MCGFALAGILSESGSGWHFRKRQRTFANDNMRQVTTMIATMNSAAWKIGFQRILFTVVMLGLCVGSAAVVKATVPSRSDSSPITVGSTITVAGLDWHTDYMEAYQIARRTGRMLLINFVEDGVEDADTDDPTQHSSLQKGPMQSHLEETISGDDGLQAKLRKVVLARLPLQTEITVGGETVRLLDHGAFQYLEEKPGIAIIDLQHKETPHYGNVVSAFPFATGKYYRWQDEYLAVALDLPPGTITQRTMIWAVRIHPEHPASTTGQRDPQLSTAAAKHSQYQADIGVQGHHRWETRFHQIRAQVNAHTATEVVAESWPGQNLIDSCIDCVASWRYSSGHWGAVRSHHRLYGYDIRRGHNGIWYGTGIFAN